MDGLGDSGRGVAMSLRMVAAALAAIALAGCSGAPGLPSGQTIANALTGPCSKPVGYDNPAWSPDGARIAFNAYTTSGGATRSVQVMTASGRDAVQLAADAELGGQSAWSPDGTRIAFTSTQGGSVRIDVVSAGLNGSGSGPVPLFDPSIHGELPVWSPGPGAHVAFTSPISDHRRVYIGGEDGRSLSAVADDSRLDSQQAWSPDGQRIAFVSDRDGNSEIYVMNADGSGQTRLTDSPAPDVFPAWSPDGKHIAFQSSRDDHQAIYVMDTDGAHQTRLTTEQGNDYAPVWSPDGKRIAFVSNRDGDQEIYVMDADGSRQARLTNSPRDDNNPVWSPDGAKIAFVSWRDNNSDIFVMNANPGKAGSGSSQAELTVNPAKARCLKWPF